jgi:signal transduction histidine kinase
MIGSVKRAEFPFLADWVAISLRWLGLVTILFIQILQPAPESAVFVAAGCLAVWNLVVSFLALYNSRLAGHRWINVLIDTAAALVIFVLSGGLSGPMAGIGALALASAAMYYEWRGAALVTLLITLSEVGITALANSLSGPELTQPLVLLAALNVAIGLFLGLLSLVVMQELRKRYHSQVSLRQMGEKRAQKEERGRMQSFYSMIETLSATIDYHLVLESALDISFNAVGEKVENSRMAAAVLLFGEAETLEVGTARGFTPTDRQRVFPGENGILAETLKTASPQQTSNPEKDSELSQVYAFQSAHSVLCLPLIRGLEAFGVMLFAHPEADFFDPERMDVLEMISHQAVIAIQNARLFQEIEMEKNRIVESQEETRKKLARDLHDGPTQSVTSIALQVHIARKMLEIKPQEAAAELEKVEDLAQRTIQEIRHLLFTLRPLTLESDGLIPALQQMSDKMKETYDQKVVLDISPEIGNQLDLSKQTVVFYIIEEAVNNARKHAEATEILIKLKYIGADHELALLDINDNGKGFDVSDVNASYDRRGSLGMVNLRERAELINGILHIDSAPGQGTKVQVVIPLTAEAIDRLQRGLVAVKSKE